MNEDKSAKKTAKYADSSLSDKAFKRMIIWFFVYCALFCIGVVLTVGADHAYLN